MLSRSFVRKLFCGMVGFALVMPAFAQDAAKEAQNKLLAKRAAEADAYRKLAETIKGLQAFFSLHTLPLTL